MELGAAVGLLKIPFIFAITTKSGAPLQPNSATCLRDSAINNARVVQDQGIDLRELLWSFAPKRRVTPRTGFKWQATSKESEAMSKELKRLGFSFVGSTTMYALMQSTGMIFDHAPACYRKE